MFLKRTQIRMRISWLLLLGAVCLYIISAPIRQKDTNFNKVSAKMEKQSKAEIVSDLKALKERIERFEKVNGRSGTSGFKVYSPEETGNLIEYYKELRTGLDYLNQGRLTPITDWEGYVLEKGDRKAYSGEEAFQILTELDETNLPSAFFGDFRVFLLPFGVPEVSGLGGAGYAMISAPETKEKSIQQLRVTLLHELGHHLHSSFMPSLNNQPHPLWEVYHEIRGGEWQGPGKVNTLAWSSSSEETFAEDFRMLFGKDQWYYGDIDLGDPREQPEVAAKLKQFMIGLKDREVAQGNKSPWIPEGLELWLHCQNYIFIGWLAVTLGVFIILWNDKVKEAQVSNNRNNHLRPLGL